LGVILASVLLSPAVFAGPKGQVICRNLGNLNITVDGHFSDWPLDSYEQASVQPLFPGAKNAASTNASGDHLVFDRNRIGLFNGTPDHPLTFADGMDDLDSVIYFAWNQDCLYMLEVRVDDLVRNDRSPASCPNRDVFNDGVAIFVNAKNDGPDCASVDSFSLFDTGAPNTDDFELGISLHNESRLDFQDPDDIGARQTLVRHGTSSLIDYPCPGSGSYRTILDAMPTPDIAARSYADLGAAGALNPVILNNPGQTFSGYALEVCVPFGFHADFDPALNPVMGFELFWHDADLCGTSFGCSDAQDDPGTGGGSISWATWAQNITDDCRSSPAGSFYQTGNWGEIVFDDGNGLGPALQLPGDCNQDGALDLSDALCALGVLFTGVPPLFPCGNGLPTDPGNIALLDWQSDGAIDLSDVLGLLQFFFFSAYAHPLAVPGSETTACVVVQGCEDNSSCP
jgi:hypothetical protein